MTGRPSRQGRPVSCRRSSSGRSPSPSGLSPRPERHRRRRVPRSRAGPLRSSPTPRNPFTVPRSSRRLGSRSPMGWTGGRRLASAIGCRSEGELANSVLRRASEPSPRFRARDDPYATTMPSIPPPRNRAQVSFSQSVHGYLHRRCDAIHKTECCATLHLTTHPVVQSVVAARRSVVVGPPRISNAP